MSSSSRHRHVLSSELIYCNIRLFYNFVFSFLKLILSNFFQRYRKLRGSETLKGLRKIIDLGRSRDHEHKVFFSIPDKCLLNRSLLTFLFKGGLLWAPKRQRQSFSTGVGVMRERRGCAHGHSI